MTATRTKRILSVQPVCDGGGSEHALIGMIRQLAADGWECHVAIPAPARLAPEYAAAGATLHIVTMERLTTSGNGSRWLSYAVHWPISVLKLAALVRGLEVDVIHTNSLHSWYGWAAAALTGRAHVWHAREIVFQSQVALRVERWLTRHFASAVIAVSEAVGSQLDAADVVVITDEADPDLFRPDRAGTFRASAGIADGTPLAGSVARIDTWKGFDVLLEAFPMMKALRPDLELVIAGGAVSGKEAYAARLEQRSAGLAGVHWMGHRRDVGELLADLDVFVQVSTEPEPFGLVVVEALASGVPVVAGAAGGPLEIMGPSGADTDTPGGRLVKPDDPAALAEAVVALLPQGPSATESRRGRRPLRCPPTGDFASLFDRIANLPRSPRPWGARTGRHRPA